MKTKKRQSGPSKMGWCMSGQHGQCFGAVELSQTQQELFCGCVCHPWYEELHPVEEVEEDDAEGEGGGSVEAAADGG